MNKRKNNVGTVIGEQDETSEKVGCRQAVRGKEKQRRSNIYHRVQRENNEVQLRELIRQDGGLRKLEIKKKWRKIRISYFKTKDQAIKAIETLDKSK